MHRLLRDMVLARQFEEGGRVSMATEISPGSSVCIRESKPSPSGSSTRVNRATTVSAYREHVHALVRDMRALSRTTWA
jgi:TPP-dependent pyruvate/acetoin dehydrogenase alpha subunit